jgi:transcriptional regulator with PAS, ATPase and Fis domain
MSDFRYMLSYLLQKKNIEQGAGIARISLRAIEKLESHDYPGNFRELERVVKTAIMNAEMEERDIVLSEDVVI